MCSSLPYSSLLENPKVGLYPRHRSIPSPSSATTTLPFFLLLLSSTTIPQQPLVPIGFVLDLDRLCFGLPPFFPFFYHRTRCFSPRSVSGLLLLDPTYIRHLLRLRPSTCVSCDYRHLLRFSGHLLWVPVLWVPGLSMFCSTATCYWLQIWRP